MKNLIIGTAINYLWHEIEPFFQSMRKYHPNDDCVMFVNNISKFATSILLDKDVILLQIPEEYVNQTITDIRWRLYNMYLSGRENLYASVLMCDVLDVVFQKNIFECYDGDGDYLAVAFESERIEGEPINRRWMIEKFGDVEFEKNRKKMVICAGTIIGDCKTIGYLNKIMDEIIHDGGLRYFPHCDQAVFQYIVYNQLLEGKKIIENSVDDGEILTIGICDRFLFDGRIVMYKSGYVPAIVHQYNRYHDLMGKVRQLYREGAVPLGISDAEDKKSQFDRVCILSGTGQVDKVCALIDRMFEGTKEGERWEGVFWRHIVFLLEDSRGDNEESLKRKLLMLQYCGVDSIDVENLRLIIRIYKDARLDEGTRNEMDALFGRVARSMNERGEYQLADVFMKNEEGF